MLVLGLKASLVGLGLEFMASVLTLDALTLA